jgi:hypothetical protein
MRKSVSPSQGSKRGAVSVGFQVQKTKERLQDAPKSGDLHEHFAALMAASSLACDCES